jgi:hypothetical protein
MFGGAARVDASLERVGVPQHAQHLRQTQSRVIVVSSLVQDLDQSQHLPLKSCRVELVVGE